MIEKPAKLIREPWQARIVAQRSVEARCLISQIANLLFDDILAATREQRLRDAGGEIIARIEKAAKARVAECEALLVAWGNRPSAEPFAWRYISTSDGTPQYALGPELGVYGAPQPDAEPIPTFLALVARIREDAEQEAAKIAEAKAAQFAAYGADGTLGGLQASNRASGALSVAATLREQQESAGSDEIGRAE